MTSMGLQYQIVRGIIHSPWIVIPLSHTNDASKECWVLRLGDLTIDTPQDSFSSKAKKDNYLYYERFHLELKHF